MGLNSIKEKLNLIREATLLVLKKPTYLVFTAVISFFLLLLFVFLNSIPVFLSALRINNSLDFFFTILFNQIDLIIGIGGIIPFATVVVVAILAAVNISMIIFKIKALNSVESKSSLLGFAGIFSGSLSSACTACSGALISILGVSGGLAVLPLRGIEFSSLAIILVLISIYYISKSLVEAGVCKIEVNHAKKKK